MKISTLTITGMHKVTYNTIAFYDGTPLTYLYGKNGAGKSTIMQAIQLALLGYIPGTDKNKTAIFRHANGNMMSVYVQFDDNTSILRKWENTGKDIKATVQLMPDTLDIQSVLAELEMPIFNFNEFASMSANKLKDWFINFLPDSDVQIDLDRELRTAAPFADSVEANMVQSAIDTINGFDGGQINQIRKFNDLCKSNISLYKSEATRLTDTMQSLVHYEDSTNVTASVIEDDIKTADLKLQVVRNKIATYRKNAEILFAMDKIKTETGLNNNAEFGAMFDSYIAAYNALKLQMSEHTASVTALTEKISDIKAQVASYEKILKSRGVCPFTDQPCATMNDKIATIKSEYQSAQATLMQETNLLNEYKAQITEITKEQEKLNAENDYLKAKYTTYLSLQKTVDKSLADTDMSQLEAEEAELVAELQKLRDILVKKQANEQYDKLKETVTKDSMKANQLLEVYKAWDKLSGVNGLQSKIMEAPFIRFSDQITPYLREFFETDAVGATFHVGEKANSFSFGITLNGAYIEYDLLSSGEKCLYTLALLIAIVQNAKSDLRLLMVDDLLDHLDDNRIEACFKTLYSVKDIQIIVAGVKPCTISSADEFVVQIS